LKVDNDKERMGEVSSEEEGARQVRKRCSLQEEKGD
jgi:hypothetical protein